MPRPDVYYVWTCQHLQRRMCCVTMLQQQVVVREYADGSVFVCPVCSAEYRTQHITHINNVYPYITCADTEARTIMPHYDTSTGWTLETTFFTEQERYDDVSVEDDDYQYVEYRDDCCNFGAADDCGFSVRSDSRHAPPVHGSCVYVTGVHFDQEWTHTRALDRALREQSRTEQVSSRVAQTPRLVYARAARPLSYGASTRSFFDQIENP